MNKQASLLSKLFSIRNQYGKQFASQKIKLLEALQSEKITGKNALQTYHGVLLFLSAYPDNAAVYQLAKNALLQIPGNVSSRDSIRYRLYNTGIPGTQLSAAYGFEIVKWLRRTYPKNVRLVSFEAEDGAIRSIVSVVMRRVESEILMDANAEWKPWIKAMLKKGEDLLDGLIAIFDQADMRPEARDELWNAIGINVEIDIPAQESIPASLFDPFYHRTLVKKHFIQQPLAKPKQQQITDAEAAQIIDSSRMILVRHLREIDPISFTLPRLISYYRLSHGLSVALMGMTKERRNPIDCYMGYVVFKNGLPVAYAGSWILFDSGRIGLNIFPAYRGGESAFIFDQVLQLHRRVYRLNRFTVDPYQLGKDNHDGIHSGAFWIYYRVGFRPLQEEQRQLAATEAQKIKKQQGYRSSYSVLTKLANTRQEWILQKKAVRFDATDWSRVYTRILDQQFKGDRKMAEEKCFTRVVEILGLKNYQEPKLQFVIKNWCVFLISNEAELIRNSALKKELKKIFDLKARGSEEEYIQTLQRSGSVRKFVESIVNPARES
jgi:hypothetical protein